MSTADDLEVRCEQCNRVKVTFGGVLPREMIEFTRDPANCLFCAPPDDVRMVEGPDGPELQYRLGTIWMEISPPPAHRRVLMARAIYERHREAVEELGRHCWLGGPPWHGLGERLQEHWLQTADAALSVNAKDVQKLRVCLGRIAQQLGLEVPGCDSDANFEQLSAAAATQDRGWWVTALHAAKSEGAPLCAGKGSPKWMLNQKKTQTSTLPA